MLIQGVPNFKTNLRYGAISLEISLMRRHDAEQSFAHPGLQVTSKCHYRRSFFAHQDSHESVDFMARQVFDDLGGDQMVDRSSFGEKLPYLG